MKKFSKWLHVQQFLRATPLWDFSLVPPPGEAIGLHGKGSSQYPASNGKVFKSTDLKHLCEDSIKLMDYAEKLPELPQTIFSSLDSLPLLRNEQKVH